MKGLILLFAVFAFASAFVNPIYKNKRYIPKMPKMPTLIPADQMPVQPYIVGGSETTPHAWPEQVALYIDNLYFCGGFLISPTWVVTAGHCTTGSDSIEVQLGAHNRSANEGTQLTRFSSSIITHAGYDASNIDNDIGLVELSATVTYSSAIQPATLPSSSDADLGAGVNLIPTGWGIQSDAILAPLSDVLYQVTVPTISNSECAAVYGSAAVPAGKICTSGAGGQGTCSGDSGGPLHYPGGGNEIRGIVSYGAAAGCTQGFPDAFTRVTHYRDWITQNTGV